MSKELGKGAAAIFSEVPKAESQILNEDIHLSEVEGQTLKDEKPIAEFQLSYVESQKMKEDSQNIDPNALEQAINEGMKYPKLTVYSPIIAAVMRYREITTPRFKLSPEAEARLEKVLKKEDPVLWKAIEERVQWKKIT
jgi:hypothetical protein